MQYLWLAVAAVGVFAIGYIIGLLDSFYQLKKIMEDNDALH